MVFCYSYRTPDGEKHEGEIKSRSRPLAYAALNAKGIRPIKVEPKPLTRAQKAAKIALHICFWSFSALLAAMIAVAGAMAGRKTAPQQVVAVVEDGKTNIVEAAAFAPVAETRKSTVSSDILAVSAGKIRRGRIAKPLARQAIRGDRARLDKALDTLFAHPSERFLAHFAEPGRKSSAEATGEILADLAATASEPIMVFDDELTECVDLKRIVAGMKREAAEYLASGGTVEEYAAELAARQAEGVEFRDKAAAKLEEFAKNATRKTALYDAWLKTNAALESWGMAPLVKPPKLRDYHPDIDFDEL